MYTIYVMFSFYFKKGLNQEKKNIISGVALKDLIFLEDCEPTILDNKINWTKMKAMGETILDVLRYQSVPYNLHYVHQIAQFFIDFSNLPTDQQFIERVLILELSERANSIV